MPIVTPRAEHADALHALYLDTVRAAPHCTFAPGLARFRAALLGAIPTPRLFTRTCERHVLVAEAGGRARGFACLTDYRDWDGIAHQAITALYFDRDDTGQALLAACEAAAGPGELLAFPPEHGHGPIVECNAGWDGLSDRLPHVARLLARSGYRPFARELHLSLDMRRFPPRPAAPPAGVTLTEGTSERGGSSVTATVGEQHAGDCYFSTLAALAEGPRAARTGYIWGLGVEEAYRRRGIARALMGVALTRLAQMGCDACWLTTGADNWPAQPLYLALGYEVVDCSASYRKR